MHMKTLVFDLDGTMYRGTQIIDTAKQFLDYCIKQNIPYLFLTNNSMRTPQTNVEHMENMGYTGISASQFYNSAMASCQYVKEKYSGRKAFFIGEKGMEQALLDAGFTITDDHPDFVFVGLTKKGDYAMYSHALTCLLQGAKLIGTNKDRILAKPGGFEVGNGSVVAMFEYATNTQSPDIAKPSKTMLDLFLRHFHLKKEDVILIGDNLETDIRLGYENGVQTIFVETGVHTRKDIATLNIHPTWIVSNLMECVEYDTILQD